MATKKKRRMLADYFFPVPSEPVPAEVLHSFRIFDNYHVILPRMQITACGNISEKMPVSKESPQTMLLEAVFNHLVLPPKLPSVPDNDSISLNWELTERLVDACKQVRCHGSENVWIAVEASMLLTQDLNRHPVSKETLNAALSEVARRKPHEWLILYIVQQNAALIIHKTNTSGEVVFEAFEVSAPASAVLETNFALQWTFPTRSVAIPESEISKSSFRDGLADFLEQANDIAFDQFAARASKGGKMVIESRDTPSPALITEMLMSFLEAMGRGYPVHAVQKRVRDDVVLGSSETPWRRSPYWLTLRVAIQRVILSSCNDDPSVGRMYFKFLMCIVFAHLLADCRKSLHPEKTLMLQAKLCRRLVKLENEMSKAPATLQLLYSREFSKERAFFESTLMETKRAINALWDAHKRSVTRSIPTLPHRACRGDLILNLPNSGRKLQDLLITRVDAPKRQALGIAQSAEGSVTQVDEVAAQCSKLMDSASKAMSTLCYSSHCPENKCFELSLAMMKYMDVVGSYYFENAVLMSQYLLNLFDLWVTMDSIATDVCPILRDYHPGFISEALEVLCLMTRDEMERLRRVQRYIHGRVKRCNNSYGTIFSHPHHTTAFPASYFRHGEGKSALHSLSMQIEAASAKSEDSKRRDLRRLMAQYEELSVEIKKGVCSCTRMPDGSVKVSGCQRCWKARCRKRLRIKVHEAFLPQEESHRATILLELRMPVYLTAYRNATWRLMILGKKDVVRSDAAIILADFGPLQVFRHKTIKSSLSLASRKKSFLQTHYRELRLPKAEDEVLLPFGPSFTYYDTEHGIWTDEYREAPWYHHLLGSWLPQGVLDPFADASLYMDDTEHPSSYDIAARQDACPRKMSSHEFAAYQRAISGVHRRWIVLVFELGSTNLNPSNEMTLKLFTRLALQSGPANTDQSSDILGKVHNIFHDPTFCERLEHQIRLRLIALDSGRRDLVCMSILITLSLRLYYLCSDHFRPNVDKLLHKFRELLSHWISQLREEVRSADSGEMARKAALSAFWASLLCRQTFDVFLNAESEPLGKEESLHFFRASIALSENLIVNLDDMSPDLKRLLAQDMSRAYSTRDKVRGWTLANCSTLQKAINETWMTSGSSKSRSFSSWNFPDGGQWITSRTTATSLVASQTIHYHVLQGHFLVDGKPLGRLPLEIRENKGILELFQGQHLLTRPSGLAGMEFQIINKVSNHELHIGLREGTVIIRAKFRGCLLEYVPREVFKSNERSDLPSGLVEDCIHWLNLRTGELEMRRKPNIWTSKASNWVLNVHSRMAMRQRTMGGTPGATTARSGTCLVEPQSEIGRHIMHIFEDFESPGNLTIFQPLSDVGRLSVEIKRLEMRFFVNARGLLQSQQLHSEIDPVQNIGTLHGLRSKLVLRNTLNIRRKSVMIPIGSFSWETQGPHVSVGILNEGSYALFTMDPLLGRLNCAPEPALFYLKALVHAVTSFPLADELTGRTGTEEACLCLTAAQSQPWKPLNALPKRILSTIMGLGPKRKFYPVDTKLYQNVFWDKSLTAMIQHEQLAIHAGDILRLSQVLDIPEKVTDDYVRVEAGIPDLHHLALRGILRRQVYERIKHPSDLRLLSREDDSKMYIPRGSKSQSKGSVRVYRTIRELREGSGRIPELPALSSVLRCWRDIDGFKHSCNELDVQRSLSAEASQTFGPLMKSCRDSDGATDCIVQLGLALFAFGQKADMKAISWLLAIANNCTLRDIEPPNADRFTDFNPTQNLRMSQVKNLVASAQDSHATYLFKCGQNRKSDHFQPLSLDEYESCISKEAESVASWLGNAWPDTSLTSLRFEKSCKEQGWKYVNPTKTWNCLVPELRWMTNNFSLSVYVESLEDAARKMRSVCGSAVLAAQRGLHAMKPRYSATWTYPAATNSCKVAYQIPSLTEVLQNGHEFPEALPGDFQLRQPPVSKPLDRPKEYNILGKLPKISSELSILYELVQPFKSSGSLIQKQYGQDLEDSIEALAWDLKQPQPQSPVLALTTEDLTAKVEAVEQDVHNKVNLIQQALSDQDSNSLWLEAGHLWPCDSLVAILEQLRFDNYKHLALHQKESLVQLGILVTKLQHLLRVYDAHMCRDEKRLLEEQRSMGHSNWTPMDYPEWLLLEVDNNILIRPIQVEVAKAIISPNSEKNSVLQMNMGKGKTSVVMPMAAMILADKTKLCRVVVPKPLLLQTAQVMQSRIGGLIGREVRHVPFSRRSPSDPATLSRYRTIHEEMQMRGGVMICVPSHILSFKLSGLQHLADRQEKVGRQMVEVQQWLDTSSRDILDESDLTLSVYTQLIYPSGDLAVIDGHPYRWLLVEELLSLVEKHASRLQKQYSGRVVVVRRHQGYPIIHFLNMEPEDALNELLVENICNGRLRLLQIQGSSSETARHHIKLIISGAKVSSSVWNSAIKSLKDEAIGTKILYLLRGLISERILLLCLKKKWNIQYGLHPQRQPIAVPFEAKGVPSQSAEYGHPDTALLLTCLAFYHAGLSKEQIKQGLQGVTQSDDPATYYDRWTCSCVSLPPSLRYWNVVDPENDLQVETLWNYLRYDRTVINHHMNTYVFPLYAKQFSVKLQASGWDIPLLQSNEVDQSGNLTTGFSGTNDNKRILPQTIKQDDLPSLRCTNAEVLCHLLESRNKDCHLAAEDGIRFGERETLKFLCDRKIRVLIDAGAHILEMDNHDVARAWLETDAQAEGAVYFGSNSQIMVHSRFQRDPMPLIASPFANDLESCVVYIDEGHTRGTDLKLPVRAKAAVTLALGQRKDETVQAAMRLRQLGTTQSVAFLAPPEVYRSISDLRRAHTKELSRPLMLTSVDVVRWLLEQSCKANEQIMALHFSQCLDFCRRTDILWKHPNFATNERCQNEVLKVIRQEEQQSLQQMYGQVTHSTEIDTVKVASPMLEAFILSVAERVRGAQPKYSSALMEVEQEREVVFEVEQIREKQSKTKSAALSFPGLDPTIMDFIITGQLDTEGTGKRAPLLQAFDYVGRTKIGARFGVKATASRLYVSHEFTHTIAVGGMMVKQEILRPVHWLLWSPSSETALIIIPEEADAVMPVLWKMNTPCVWLLSYEAPVTKAMQIFNSLTYLTVPTWPDNRRVPTWLSIEVGFLSGRLYFEVAEYKPLLAWLTALLDEKYPSDHNIGESAQLLQEWVTHRRQSDDVLYTPVGFVCQRQLLYGGHFFFLGYESIATSLSNMSSEEAYLEDIDEVEDTERAKSLGTWQ